MTDLAKAVALYFEREAAAMKTMRGADHRAILEDVAKERGVDAAVLTEAVISATIAGAN